jgi:uncharacterized protein (DUF2147 family)
MRSAIVCVSAFFATAAAAMPLGEWARGDGNARVRIQPCGAALCAINTWIRDSSNGEKVGDRLVMTVKPGENGRLVGSAFDPQRDRSYGITITYSASQMSTRGCLIGVLCKTVTWTKIR